MTFRSLVPAVFLASLSCTAPGQDPFAESEVTRRAPPAQGVSPAPYGALTLVSPPIALDESITFTVSGSHPGDSVYLVASDRLDGSYCYRIIGDQCLDIGPLHLLGVATADGSGDAELAVIIDSSTVSDGETVAVQAVVIRGLGGGDSIMSNATTGTAHFARRRWGRRRKRGRPVPPRQPRRFGRRRRL